MNPYSELVNEIKSQTGGSFRNASENDLSRLRKFELPSPVLDFYAEFEPVECVEGIERLWPISRLIEENTNAVPGCDILEHGYFVFATTYCGDTYCFDLNNVSHSNEPPIVFMSHEEDYEAMHADEIHKLAEPVASNLLEFLEWFHEETKNMVNEE